jgi:hypothetical protein
VQWPLRPSASTAIELVGFAFLLPAGLPRVEESDQVAAMDQHRSTVIDGEKPCLEPPPDRVSVQFEQIGDL